MKRIFKKGPHILTEKYYGWGLPINISAHGAEIDRIIYIVHALMAVLFVGWMAFLIYVLIRFRQRPDHKPSHHETHFKAPTYLEVGIAIFEVVLLFAFAIPAFNKVKRDFPPESEALRVRVVAEQFAWNVHYPGKDGVFGKTEMKLAGPMNPLGLDPRDEAGKDDVTTINQFLIPVHKPVIVELSSKDVIHSFSLTVMRVKQDVIPGHRIPIAFEAVKTGIFEITCARLCGLGHYRMRGSFNVKTQEEFNQWLSEEDAKKKGA